MLPLYLSSKEIWRNKSRFISVSLVIALITLLVLFISALGEGLALAGKEYLENLNEDAEILIFQENVDIAIPSSRLGRSKLNDLSRHDPVVSGTGTGARRRQCHPGQSQPDRHPDRGA